MTIKTIFCALSWPLLFIQTSAHAREILPQSFVDDLINLNCVRADGSKIDERKIHRVINREINYSFEGRATKFSIYDERARIQYEDEDGYSSVRIDRLLDENKNLDINLWFAYFSGQLFLYWSETYAHRPARHGLIEIDQLMDFFRQEDEQPLKKFCEGAKGAWVE
ncbi:hypothetical protein N9D37_00620 [Erythrobacter sp.]|nr:hypothetical protein [Erythrobacter sp.]